MKIENQLTLTQLLPTIGLSRQSLYLKIQTGKLKATKRTINGRSTWLIDPTDLEKFIKSRD